MSCASVSLPWRDHSGRMWVLEKVTLWPQILKTIFSWQRIWHPSSPLPKLAIALRFSTCCSGVSQHPSIVPPRQAVCWSLRLLHLLYSRLFLTNILTYDHFLQVQTERPKIGKLKKGRMIPINPIIVVRIPGRSWYEIFQRPILAYHGSRTEFQPWYEKGQLKERKISSSQDDF